MSEPATLEASRIRQWIGRNEDRIVELLSQLVAHDTVNRVVTGMEADCQRTLHEKLLQLGFRSELYCPEQVPGFREHPAYYPGKDYSDRPNVWAEWKGAGGGRSLLFSSHIDTAAIAPGWQGDPFRPTVKDGRLYGLGAFDMKGGLVASILAVRCLMELGLALRGDVRIESVVDEEFGGANGTVAGAARGPAPDAVIIPEPTNLALYPATRGGALWRVTFRGNTGLSFSGETIENAATSAAAFITFLGRFEKQRAVGDPRSPWYAASADPLPIIVTRVEAGDMTVPLCDVGPVEAHVDIWVECLPGVSEEQLKGQLLEGYEAFCGTCYEDGLHRPEFRRMIRFLPGSSVNPAHPLIAVLTKEIARATGADAVVTGAPFACDAFVFNEYGESKALVLGPSGANAHAPDEYVELDSMAKLIEIYALTMIQWCGRA